jgi:transcriptional regulator with GAF, ATPase, and Fis domain
VPQAALTLAGLEAEHIRAVLESTNWRVRGSGGAAQRLGLNPTTLESRMERLGINRPTTGL